MGKLGEWLDGRARKKELKAQIETETARFNKAIKDAETAVAKVPESERRTALARVQVLRDRYNKARVDFTKSKSDTKRETLVVALLQLVIDASPKPQAQAPTPQAPQRPTSQPTESLQPFVTEVQAIGQAATAAGLSVPVAVSKAVGDAGQATGPNATPKAVQEARQQLQAVIAGKPKFLGFVKTWLDSAADEDKLRQALPEPKALFTPFESAWTKSREKIENMWQRVDSAAAVDGCVQELGKIQNLLASNRQGLIERHKATTQRLEAAAQRISGLGVTKLYELELPRKFMADARVAFGGGETPQKLDKTMKVLETVEAEIRRAEGNLGEARTKALEQYAKRRRALVDQLAAARLMRGALDVGTEAGKQVAAVNELMLGADAMLARAITSGHVADATQKLEDAIALKIDTVTEKLAGRLKDEAEADLKALPEYEKLFAQLMTVRAEVAQIPGGHVQLQEADALIALTRVDGTGKPRDGFATATTRIRQFAVEQIKVRALKASTEFVERGLSSEAKTAMKEVEQAIVLYALCHPPSLVDAQRRAMAAATKDPRPEDALMALARALTAATGVQQQLKKDLRGRVEAITVRLNDLKTQGMPANHPDMVEMERQLAAAELARVESRLEDSKKLLDRVDDVSDQATREFTAAKAGWANALVQLKTLRTRAEALSHAPGAIGNLAAGVVGDIAGLLTRLDNGTIDFRAAIATAANLAKSGHELEEDAAAASFGPQFDMAGFKTASDKLMKAWEATAQEVTEGIAALGESLVKQGVKAGAGSTPWPKALADLNKRRKAASESIEVENGEDPTTALTRVHAGLIGELNQLLFNLPNPGLPNSPEYKETLEGGKRNEVVAACRKAYDLAESLMLQIENARGAPQPQLRQELGAFVEADASPELSRKFAVCAQGFASELTKERNLIKQKKAPTKEAGKKLKGELAKKLLSRQSDTFRGLFDDLSARVDDALAMLEEDDATLIAAAEHQLAEIRLTLDDAKGKGDKAAVTLEMVGQSWEELSKALGENTERVQRRMPQTYARLKLELDTAIAAARRLPPNLGLEGLEKLRGPIIQARDTAKELQVKYESWKQRRDLLKEQFEEMKDHTGATLLGGRTKAFNDRFDSRVSDAQALARQEGQLDAAGLALGVLETEMKSLLDMKPDEAREKLQGMDAEAEGEQRELRDLARNWNATQAYWEDTLLPAVRSAVVHRKEDVTEVNSLKASIATVGKTLDGYLAVVSGWPHKRGTANEAPDMAAARKAFSQAYMRVSQLEKAAVRLRDGAGTTNIELVSDLIKLEQEWTRRATEATRALAQISENMKRWAADANDTVGDPNFLADPARTTLKDSVKHLTPLLEKLGGRVSATAFTAPLAVLRRETSTQSERKAAREQALRTARQIKADVVDNPLLQELFTGASDKVLDIDPRPPISFLRASLKKVELAVLVGI